MKRKYLAFDIETAKILPASAKDLLEHRPLGICCAAVLASDENMPHLFYTVDANETPTLQMSQDDVSKLVDFLQMKTCEGYTIVTHNGLGFDFDVLAEESGRRQDCKQLALAHVDMMFHLFCEKGFPVGLNAAAKVLGLSKPEDVDGAVAPQLWRDGQHDTVLSYVAQDCKLTQDIALASEDNGSFKWLTQRGKTGYLKLPNGWLTVKEAMQLPLPDTSWMDTPMSRSKFTGWVE